MKASSRLGSWLIRLTAWPRSSAASSGLKLPRTVQVRCCPSFYALGGPDGVGWHRAREVHLDVVIAQVVQLLEDGDLYQAALPDDAYPATDPLHL